MPIDENDDRLLELAGDIADGRPVDWERAEASDPRLADAVGALRALEGVVVAHASIPDAPSLPPNSTWGSLRILEMIGSGSYGEVYRAFDETLEREVALKLLHSSRCANPAELRRFLDEARRLARVRHPHVLVVHGADVHEGRAGMWTDLIRGRTLEALLEAKGPLGAHEAAPIGVTLCRALAALHAADLVHRDVKTQNVMREQWGRIVLMDFGSVGEARFCEADAHGGNVRSTPLTAAPELLRSEPATRASDIYGLGVLLYRLTTGAYPYEASDVDELVAKHASGAGRPLRDLRPDLPAEFVRAVERALDPDPARRTPGCAALERELLPCLGTETHAATNGSVAAAPPRAESGRKIPLWAAATLGLATLALAISLVPQVQQRLSGSSEETGERAVAVGRTALEPHTSSAPSGAVSRIAPGATPATSPSSLVATAALFRQNAEGRELLPQNARVSTGDALFLEVKGPEPMNVYVLNEDADGHLFVLYPLPGLDESNPLAGGAPHRLPGTRAGAIENWEVSSPGGAEDLLVIASRRPIEGLERELARVPRASADQPYEYPEVSKETAAKLRGIGRVRQQDPAAAAEPGRLSAILTGIARAPSASLEDLWMWQTRLYNPVP